MSKNKWIVIAAPHGIELATALAVRLESSGIPALVDRNSAAPGLPGLFGPHGQARVLVPEEYYQDALQILGRDSESRTG